MFLGSKVVMYHAFFLFLLYKEYTENGISNIYIDIFIFVLLKIKNLAMSIAISTESIPGEACDKCESAIFLVKTKSFLVL